MRSTESCNAVPSCTSPTHSIDHDVEEALFEGNSEAIERPPSRRLTVTHLIESGHGGIDTAVSLLVAAQSNDPEFGDIHIVADRSRLGKGLLETQATMHFYKSDRKVKHLWRVSREAYRLLSRTKPDVVYLHSTFPGLYGRLYRKAGYAPWVTIYCPHGWAFTQRVSAAKRRAYIAVEKLLSSRADAIISISHDEFSKATQGGLKHPNHKVILHGIPRSPQSDHPGVFQNLPGTLNLLFLGRFDPQKGLDLLLDAWSDRRLDNIHLWIIGDAVRAESAKVAESPNVHLLGWIPNNQIDSYIKSVDAVIMPSRWEAFGLVALEAMRNGKPVLASRVGGLKELIVEGANGLFIDPLDSESLVNTLSSLTKEQLASMGAAAEGIFQAGFTWDSCYARWRTVTLQAVSEHRDRVEGRKSALKEAEGKTFQFAKWCVDFSCGVLALLLLSPILLCISIIVKVTSPGTVFFGNRRVGKHGRVFRAWKFRSMYPDSESILHKYLLAHPEAQEELNKFHKLRDDPRITPFGKILRRTSLDELPQFFNIVLGDMSLVGPRPIVESEIPRYRHSFDVYLAVKPGLTGLWQVSGRSQATFEERIAFDEYYVRNWSVWMDIRILLRTIYVVFFTEGAY